MNSSGFLNKNIYRLNKKSIVSFIILFFVLWYCVGILFSVVYSILYITRLVFRERMKNSKFYRINN